MYIQRFIILLSLILYSFSFQNLISLSENDTFKEEPQLISVSKNIVEKKEQEVTLIFQNSKICFKGLQQMYLRDKNENILYNISLIFKQQNKEMDNLIAVICKIDLLNSDIKPGNYMVESIKYKDKFYIDEKIIVQISKNKDFIEFIGINEILTHAHYFLFDFNYNEYVDLNAIKSIKIANEKKEFEFSLERCSITL